MDPGTMPQDNNPDSSAEASGMRRADSNEPVSITDTASAVPAVLPGFPALAAFGASATSSILFQASQVGHLPAHLAWVCEQFWQRNMGIGVAPIVSAIAVLSPPFRDFS